MKAKPRFIRITFPSAASDEVPLFPEVTILRFLCAVETTAGVGRLVRDRRLGNPGEKPWRERTYFIAKHPLAQVVPCRLESILSSLGSAVARVRIEFLHCACLPEPCMGTCFVSQPQPYDYTSVVSRTVHTYPAIQTDPNLQQDRPLQIAQAIDRIDPSGKAEFDIRANLVPAELHGCQMVVDSGAREAPYGLALAIESELKTLCYFGQTKRQGAIIVVVNLMANFRVNHRAVKRAIAQAGIGTIKNLTFADIESLFGLKTGEVQPLLLLPRCEPMEDVTPKLTVVHLYDERLLDYGYVTTNGGTPLWTTEFRRDELVRCMQTAFSTVAPAAAPLVVVADIAEQDPRYTTADMKTSSLDWQHEVVSLGPGSMELEASGGLPFRPGLLSGDTTTAFTELLSASIARERKSSTTRNESHHARFHILRNPLLDFHLVKFPQCWRTVFRELARGVVKALQLNIRPLFVDCNILPAHEFLRDRLVPAVRSYVLGVLRAELQGQLDGVSDDRLLAELQERVQLLPKAVLVAERVRKMVQSGILTDAFLVGGAQVADPSLSLLHNELIGITGLKVHALGPEETRSVRRAMFLEEQPGTETPLEVQQRKAEELVAILDRLHPAMTAAKHPVVFLASTSLCHAFHSNNNRLIPDSLIPHLASRLGDSMPELERKVTAYNLARVVSTTELHAEAVAAMLRVA